MLLSISYVFLSGILFGWICKKINIPRLFGMIIAGIVIGPYFLNLIDKLVLNISDELRKIALIVILLRAGLSLDLEDLKKVGRPAVFMCFLPACFEIIGMAILGPTFLNMNLIDALITGAVIAAVSPAVIVPKMIKIMKEKYGTKKSIPQLILAGSSVDDIFVIVMFSAFIGMAKGERVSYFEFLKIPLSLISGILVGVLIGYLLYKLFGKFEINNTIKVLIVLSISFILVSLEDKISLYIPFSALLSIMMTGILIQRKSRSEAICLSEKFENIWCAAEIILFVLVGAIVNINYAFSEGVNAVYLIFLVLLFRGVGVFLSIIGTNLNKKEKLFCILAYIPKATVQAAIGAIPLSMGLSCGNRVLTLAVLSILITAPLGAFLIENSYKKLLEID